MAESNGGLEVESFSLFQVLRSETNMSLQWTLVASFLYGEIAVVFLLIIPFISPKM